jgi:hypothetical protein
MFKVGDRVSYIWQGDDKEYTGTVIERLERPHIVEDEPSFQLLRIQVDNDDFIHEIVESPLIKIIEKEKK